LKSYYVRADTDEKLSRCFENMIRLKIDCGYGHILIIFHL